MLLYCTERATMNGSSTVLEHKRSSKEQEQLNCHSLWHDLYFPLLPGGNVDEYAKHLFRVLDTDKDNLVSFQEVMVGFHNLSGGGDEKEKLKMVFQV